MPTGWLPDGLRVASGWPEGGPGRYSARSTENSETKKYHRPLDGAKVFIQAVQQVNGWESDVMMFVSAAIVPPRAARAARETRAPGPAKAK